MTIRCHIDRISASGVAGWAWDPTDPDAVIRVDIFHTERPLGTAEASLYRADLEHAGYRGGRCAFELRCAHGQRIADPTAVRAVFRHPVRSETCELRGALIEDDGSIDFANDGLDVLKPLGLALHSLRGRQRLGPKTMFEPPLVVLAQIASGTSVEIGAFTGVYGSSLNRCTIGRYCSIAPDVVIGPNEHPIDWLSTSIIAEMPGTHDWDAFIDPARTDFFRANALPFEGNAKRTVIGNDVWLGNGVFVRSGVTIGDGAVIGARSVVVADIPPYAIAVGNPARVKRMRFDDKTIERLQRLRWWRYSLYDLSGTRFDRLDEAIAAIEEAEARGAIAEYRPETYDPARLRAALARGRAARQSERVSTIAR
jgi:acetyltransferase-like isoleucine patch superfamily enzyme